MYKAIWKDGEVKGAKERTVAVKKLHALPAGAEPIREFCKEVVLMQVTGCCHCHHLLHLHLHLTPFSYPPSVVLQRMDHRNLLPLLGVWMPPDGSFAMVTAQFGAIRRNVCAIL